MADAAAVRELVGVVGAAQAGAFVALRVEGAALNISVDAATRALRDSACCAVRDATAQLHLNCLLPVSDPIELHAERLRAALHAEGLVDDGAALRVVAGPFAYYADLCVAMRVARRAGLAARKQWDRNAGALLDCYTVRGSVDCDGEYTRAHDEAGRKLFARRSAKDRGVDAPSATLRQQCITLRGKGTKQWTWELALEGAPLPAAVIGCAASTMPPPTGAWGESGVIVERAGAPPIPPPPPLPSPPWPAVFNGLPPWTGAPDASAVLSFVRSSYARLGCADERGTTALHIAAISVASPSASSDSPATTPATAVVVPLNRVVCALAECADAAQRSTWCDQRGCTPLHYAAFADDARLVTALALFGCGALPACATVDRWGRTPRCIAKALGNERVAAALVKLESQSADALWCAARESAPRCAHCTLDITPHAARWCPQHQRGAAEEEAAAAEGTIPVVEEEEPLASVETAEQDDPCAIGAQVVLCALRSAALNGARGTVLARDESTRVGVEVTHPQTGRRKRVSVRWRNVHVVLPRLGVETSSLS